MASDSDADAGYLDWRLHEACKAADQHTVQKLIEAGADINRTVGPPGAIEPCLVTAVCTGSLSFVSYLLQQGASPQIAAIKSSAGRGDVPMLELLLEPVKRHLKNPEAGFSEKRWRKDLAAVLEHAMLQGQAATAEVLMVFKDRLQGSGAWNKDLIRSGFSHAVARRDAHSTDVFLQIGAKDLGDVLQLVARAEDFTLLQSLISTHNFDVDVISLAMPAVARAGQTQILQSLLDHGANDRGEALCAAVRCCQSGIARQLFTHTRYGKDSLSEALRTASAAGDIESIYLLLNHNAPCRGSLEAAAKNDQVKAIEILLAYGSNSPDDLSAAMAEAMFEWARRLELLGSDLTSKFLEQARSITKPKALLKLIDGGVVPSEETCHRMLEFMILSGNDQDAGYILDRFLNGSQGSTKPDTYLLALAIFHRRRSITSHLIGNYPRVLMDAGLSYHLRLRSDLVETDLDKASTKAIYNSEPSKSIHPLDFPYPTPLLAAVMNSDVELVRRLLKVSSSVVRAWCRYKPNKASYYDEDPVAVPRFACLPNAFGKDEFHLNPLACALEYRQHEIVKLLLQFGADPWLDHLDGTNFQLAASKSMLRDLVFWKPENASRYINREVCGGKTLLHWAAAYGDRDCNMQDPGCVFDSDLVADLVKQGADVNHRHQLAPTPIHAAIKTGAATAVEQLCWAGADLSLKATQWHPTQQRSVDADAVEYAKWLVENPSDEENEVIRGKRFSVAEFLQRWRTSGVSHLDASSIRQAHEEDLAAKQRMENAADWREELEDAMLDGGDDESLHLSDVEGEQDEEGEEWDMVPENPQEL